MKERFIIVGSICMTLGGIALGLFAAKASREEARTHMPTVDACVRVYFRDKPSDANGTTVDNLMAHIKVENSQWMALGRQNATKASQWAWIPISNVAAVWPYDNCDDDKK